MFNRFNNTFFLFLFFLFSPSHETFATHSMGADMTYECMGNGQYKIRVSFYRDCAGIQAPPAVMVTAYSPTCNLHDTIILFPIPGTGIDITPLCPSQQSTCHGGTFTGIQEWVYEGFITFSAQCPDWQLIYEQCCRNGAITTISQPLGEEMLIYSILNNTLTDCNNSPTFSNKPVPFVCMGQQFCFNHGAIDVDGDSLVYEVVTPMSYFGLPVQYFAPYSPYQPLNSVPAMTLDIHTGDFCITPQSPEVTVMAILVHEFRNGVEIGAIERDIQVTVIPCTNTLPLMSGINGTNNFSATICADAQFCFDAFSNDVDSGQILSVTWNQAIPGATFNAPSAAHPTGQFCWTPTQAQAGPVPHCFTIQVSDDACPVIGSQTFSYCLTVTNVNVDAGPDKVVSCGGMASLSGSASTSVGNLTYQWSNGATTLTPSVGAGTYTLTASNGLCTATDEVNVTVNAGPIAAFNFSPSCPNTPMNFSDLSNANGGSPITIWNWDFGDGTTSSQQNPSHQYTTPGNYNVCLNINTTSNCPNTICQNITVNPVTTASFTTSDACLGVPTSIVNNTPTAGTVFNWDFGNGTTSNSASPSVTYSNSGNYTVTLIATDASGCKDTLQQPVTINSLPVAGFNSVIVDPCQGGLVDFTDASSLTVNTWNWDFGNGQTSALQNPSATLPQGNSSVTLTVIDANGCTDTETQPITINAPFVAVFDPPQTICIGGNANIAASGGVGYVWSTGQNGSSINVSPTSTTTYTVTVSDANNCSVTGQVVVNVNPLPLVDAGPNQNTCTGVAVNLNGTGAVSYAWSTGANTPSITVNPVSPTTYTVTGTDANGCINIDTVAVNINPQLTVIPGDYFICPGEIAIIDAGFPGYSYQWSSGQTTQTISVQTAGNYTVVVTDPNGCTGSGLSNVSVGGTGLVANPSTSIVCNGQAALLNAGNPGSSYLWSTGDTTQSIQVSNAGNYQVTVTDPDGCTISFSSDLLVNPLPNVAFTSTDVCQTLGSVFTNTTTVATGSIQNYQWNFGDGNTSSAVSPTHVYGNSGTFNVTLSATTDSGCVQNIIQSIQVYPLPLADFLNTSVCLGDSTLFTNTSTINQDTIQNWYWSFGDGTVSVSENPRHVYQSFGNFPVGLIVESIHGCTDTISRNIDVNPLPSSDAGPDSVLCSGNPLSIGTPPVNGITYQWSPTANLTQVNSSQTNFSFSNNTDTPVDFDYFVSATNQFGCTATDTVRISVKPLPPLTFSAPSAQCLDGNLYLFIPTGTVNSNTALSWNFGTGASPATSSNTSPVQVSYSTPGLRPVTLAYSYMGCPGSPTTDSVNVLEMPLGGFIPSPYEGCASLNVTFYNTHPNNNYQYTWQIQGQTLHDEKPSWTFDEPGNYRITQIVTNEYGCVSQPEIANVNVHPVPVADFTNSPDSGWIFQSLISFENYSQGAAQYQWDFGDGTTDDFFNGEHAYTDTGTFNVRLIAISVHGCIDTIYGRVRIYEGFSFYVPNAFSPNDDGINDSFQGYGTYINSYEMWIYDRWGLMIYHTNDYYKPWDGRIHTMAQNDTYVYRIRVTDFSNKDHIFIGSVTLVK